MPKNRIKKTNARLVPKKDSKPNKKRSKNKPLDNKMKDFFKIIDDNIEVFKRLNDK